MPLPPVPPVPEGVAIASVRTSEGAVADGSADGELSPPAAVLAVDRAVGNGSPSDTVLPPHPANITPRTKSPTKIALNPYLIHQSYYTAHTTPPDTPPPSVRPVRRTHPEAGRRFYHHTWPISHPRFLPLFVSVPLSKSKDTVGAGRRFHFHTCPMGPSAIPAQGDLGFDSKVLVDSEVLILAQKSLERGGSSIAHPIRHRLDGCAVHSSWSGASLVTVMRRSVRKGANASHCVSNEPTSSRFEILQHSRPAARIFAHSTASQMLGVLAFVHNYSSPTTLRTTYPAFQVRHHAPFRLR